ncbi:MAG: PAS domain S-box protein [Actinomycetota bacterium]|nr:PAS domain S-box protein [Actinomycetota bacterium]
MENGRSRYIEQRISDLSHYWVGITLFLGSFIFLLLSGLDYFIANRHFQEFLALRISIALFLLLWFYLLKKFDPVRRGPYLKYPFILAGTFLSALVIEVMIMKLGGYRSGYYAGLNLIVFVVLGFVPLDMAGSALCVSVIYLTYLVPILMFNRITDMPRFISNNAFLLCTIIIALVWRALNQRNLRKTLGLQYDLDRGREELAEYSSGLAKMVEKRTNELNKSELMFRSLFESATDAIMLLDGKGNILNANRRACELHGMELDSLIYRNIGILETGEEKALLKDRLERILAGESLIYETRHFRQDGKVIVLESSSCAVPVNNDLLIQCFFRDITEKKSLQEQLLQSQKMECVGQLAGGIAHDFNNVLSAILGTVELIKTRKDDISDWVLEKSWRIEFAARKAAKMVSQLLSFGRRSSFEPVFFDLNDIINETADLLKRLMPATIKVSQNLMSCLPFVKGDFTQMESVIMNLMLNARDAMPDGGTLNISTSLVELTAKDVYIDAQVKPGCYIKMTVSDNGTGIKQSDLAHIFEPFYTTKEHGKGTGLGLSMVYGIVKSHEGSITVSSVPGMGTSFDIYIPCAPEYKPQQNTGPEQTVACDNETVLVIDDDRSALELVSEALSGNGFNVISASSPLEGLAIYKKRKAEIALVITDIVMPEMDGLRLAKALRDINPAAKIISVTGFSEYSEIAGAAAMLRKPFSGSKLLLTVREVLESA